MVKRELIGRVFVDSGAVVVADPMHCELSERDQHVLIDELATVTHCDFGATDVPGSPDHLGVAVRSGWGDGCYPVYLEHGVDAVDGTQVVARLIVDFLTTEEGAREEAEALAAQSADGVEDVVRDWALGEAS
jgi:hypothetical protein